MPESPPAPEEYARRLLNRLELSNVGDLAYVLKSLRLTVKEVNAATFEGALVYRQDRSKGIVLLSDKVTAPGRRRFTICHEVGHFILPGHGKASCRPSDIESFQKNLPQQEIDANAVASELLLPTRILHPLVRERKATITLAKEVSRSFGTSLTAAALKIVSLTEEACAFVWSESGSARWFKRNENFFGFISLGKLDEQSIAAGLFRDGGSSIEEGEVHRECWILGNNIDGSKRIWEESIYLSGYDAVLSILTMI
mgnify:CR=1 FL=1